jgi:hypothetical protein
MKIPRVRNQMQKMYRIVHHLKTKRHLKNYITLLQAAALKILAKLYFAQNPVKLKKTGITIFIQ